MTNLRRVRRGVLGGLGHEFLLSRGVNLLQSILGNEGFVLKILATQKASGPNGSRENPLGAVRFVGRLRSHLKRLADPLGQFPMIGRRGGQAGCGDLPQTRAPRPRRWAGTFRSFPPGPHTGRGPHGAESAGP